MSHDKVRPLRLDFKTSRIFTILMWLLCTAALIIVWCMPILLWLKMLMSLLILPAGYYTLIKHAWLLHQQSVVQLDVYANSELRLSYKNGETVLAKVLPSTVVIGYFTLLNLTIFSHETAAGNYIKNNQRQYLLIFPDSCQHEGFRRLRVWLRWGVSFDQQSSARSEITEAAIEAKHKH